MTFSHEKKPIHSGKASPRYHIQFLIHNWNASVLPSCGLLFLFVCLGAQIRSCQASQLCNTTSLQKRTELLLPSGGSFNLYGFHSIFHGLLRWILTYPNQKSQPFKFPFQDVKILWAICNNTEFGLQLLRFRDPSCHDLTIHHGACDGTESGYSL